MKKLLFTTVVTPLLFSGIAFADSSDVKVPFAPSLGSVAPVMEHKEDVSFRNIKKGQEKASHLIDQRIKAITSNQEAITKNKKLTVDQKAILASSTSAIVAELTKLKAAIATSTDATSTKSLVDSIFKDYRVFGIVIPKLRLEARIYQLKNHAQELSNTFLKIQTKIDEQKAKGHDVASWQSGLDGAKMLVAQDMYKLDQMLKDAASLTPATYGTTSKALIDSLNANLKSVTKDFNTVTSKVRKPSKLPKMTIQNATSTATSTPR